MKVYLTTLLAILIVELTDKTRVIALMLSARYQAPIQLVCGMTLGYVPAIAVAVLASGTLSQWISLTLLKWIVALSFLGFGLYLIYSRGHEEEEKNQKRWIKFERLGPFWVGFILVSLTEFGDKSQLATASLALKYRTEWPVFLGSLSAQVLLNIAYVGLGTFLAERIPVKLIHWISGITFLIFGILAILA